MEDNSVSSGFPGSSQTSSAAASSGTMYRLENSVGQVSEGDEWQLVSAGSSRRESSSPHLVFAKLRTEFALAQPAASLDANTFQFVLSAVAPLEQSSARAAIHLVAVLDKSGSMGGGKLKLVIETMTFMLDHFTDRDALGIVVYDTQVEVLAPLTRCNEDGRARLRKSLKQLRHGSRTNLSGGLLRGLALHGEDVQVAPTCLQSVQVGNAYRRLCRDLEAARAIIGKAYHRFFQVEVEVRPPPPLGSERIHEWTMQLRFEDPKDMALVRKVVYKLHRTFKERVIEVCQPPFHLKRVGWGFFTVGIKLHLIDGRVLSMQHELCFDRPESFHTELLPLQSSPVEMDSTGVNGADRLSIVRSTFLFTDGLANRGITTEADLVDASKNALQELGTHRCSISTFGFGKDHSADLLQEVASAGNGIYSYIENQDQIGEAFGEALGGLLSTTHQNVRLSLELEPEVDLVQVCTSYPVDGPVLSVGGKKIVRVDVGDLFAEERRDILLEVMLPEVFVAEAQHIGTLSARAFNVSAKCYEDTDPCNVLVRREAATDLDAVAPRHAQVERHHLRYTVTKALKDASAAAAQRNLAAARAILDGVHSALSASYLTIQGDAVCIGLLADINECKADLQNQESYRSSGSKKMEYMRGSHERQRGSYGHSKTYKTSSMDSMSKNFASKSGW